MNTIDVVGYILKNYPHKDELSKGRLNKLIYLCDWKSSIDNGVQLTPIEWKFNHYGPYVDEIETAIVFDDRISINVKQNYYGSAKHLVTLDKDEGFSEPNNKDKSIIDFIIEATKSLYWNEFINAVYSTYPIKNSERGDMLNLVELAKQYRLKGV